MAGVADLMRQAPRCQVPSGGAPRVSSTDRFPYKKTPLISQSELPSGPSDTFHARRPWEGRGAVTALVDLLTRERVEPLFVLAGLAGCVLGVMMAVALLVALLT